MASARSVRGFQRVIRGGWNSTGRDCRRECPGRRQRARNTHGARASRSQPPTVAPRATQAHCDQPRPSDGLGRRSRPHHPPRPPTPRTLTRQRPTASAPRPSTRSARAARHAPRSAALHARARSQRLAPARTGARPPWPLRTRPGKSTPSCWPLPSRIPAPLRRRLGSRRVRYARRARAAAARW